jgi:hypothetical protein
MFWSQTTPETSAQTVIHFAPDFEGLELGKGMGAYLSPPCGISQKPGMDPM